MVRSRWIPGAAAAVALIVLLVRWATSTLARAGTLPLSPATERALDDIEERKYPRLVHRGVAVEGSFGDALEEHGWASIAAALAADPCDPPCRCALGADLEEPVCRAFLESTRPSLAPLLGATLRAEGGFGAARGIFAPLGSGTTAPLPPEMAQRAFGVRALPLANFAVTRLSIAVCKRAALEIAALAARGDEAGALRTCADAMAWARDAALGGNLVQAMASVASLRIAATACKAAIGTASRSDREELARALGVVRRGLPAIGDVGRDDMTVGWLRSCGPILDEGSRGRLSPIQAATATEAERLLAAAGAPALGRFDRMRLASQCREAESKMVALRAMTTADAAATEDLRKHRDEAEKAYGELDELIAGLAPASPPDPK